MNFYNIFSLKYYKMEINLPADIIRSIFKICLKADPLFIFTFTSEIFILGDYEKREKEDLIIDSLKSHYEKSKLPIFNKFGNYNQLYKDENFLYILEIIKDKITTENINYIFIDAEIENLYVHKNINLNCLLYITSIKRGVFENPINLFLYCVTHNYFSIVKSIYYRFNVDISKIIKIYSTLSCRANNLEMLQWIFSKTENNIESNFAFPSTCYFFAIKNENYKMLLFLHFKNKVIKEEYFSYSKIFENLKMEKFLLNLKNSKD